MPIYVYKCEQNHTTEILFNLPSEASGLVECGVCGSSDTRKIIQATGWKLKGVGWPSQAMKRSQENFPKLYGKKRNPKREFRREI